MLCRALLLLCVVPHCTCRCIIFDCTCTVSFKPQWEQISISRRHNSPCIGKCILVSWLLHCRTCGTKWWQSQAPVLHCTMWQYSKPTIFKASFRLWTCTYQYKTRVRNSGLYVSYNIFLWTNQSLTTLAEFFVFDSLPAYQGYITDVTEGRDTPAMHQELRICSQIMFIVSKLHNISSLGLYMFIVSKLHITSCHWTALVV